MGAKKGGGDKKGKKSPRERNRVKKGANYEVSAEKIECKRTPCPKCGAGVFMGEHKNRSTCGKCGYTKWKQ